MRPLRVCLVSALNAVDFGDPETTLKANEAPTGQLGVLSLAASLRQAGYEPQIVDLDYLFLACVKDRLSGAAATKPEGVDLGQADGPHRHRNVGGPAGADLFASASDILKTQPCEVFGFSSICSSYPLTLRLAQEVTRWHPNATLVLGGPQATVVDVPTMEAFAFIDFVVRGEADATFPALLETLAHPESAGWTALPGITFRREGRVFRNRDAPPVHDLDCLPLPAFDLDPFNGTHRAIPLEIGRGCPFACTFCSTSDFFRHKFRLKSPGKIVAEMQQARQEHGAESYSLIHDLYTVDRKRVRAFCQALKELDDEFVWACSARTDCIDDDLIGLMAEAGCEGIFFGIETGSPRLQQVINKKLDLVEARQRIRAADHHGMHTAVSFIVGFAGETRQDLRDTVHFFVEMLRLDHAEPQISLLAPLAGTPIHEEYRDRLVFDGIFSDMSHQGWGKDPAELAMIEAYPAIFPNFYAVPTISLARAYLCELTEFLNFAASWFRWLPVALLQDSGDFLAVFDRWRDWLAARTGRAEGEDVGHVAYYAHRRFHNEFLEFVRDYYLPEMATNTAPLRALTLTESITTAEKPRAQANPPLGAGMPAGDLPDLDLDAVPHPPAGLCVVDLDVDYSRLVACLRNGQDLVGVPERACTVVFLPGEERRTQVWQLSPLSARLLALCDGRRTVAEIIRQFRMAADELDGLPVRAACLFGLERLRKDGFLEITSPVDC